MLGWTHGALRQATHAKVLYTKTQWRSNSLPITHTHMREEICRCTAGMMG